ncbi:MAG: hypothetical protein IPO65_20925 [Saprospiraceae bacterium]|nr:hypothetical protein [Saprospiraceae bacterium]
MKINGNAKLIHITDFNSLDTLGGLKITYNGKLPVINGFHQLSIVSSIYISDCFNLNTITGFEKLLQSGSIELFGSSSLKKLEGFEQLKAIAGFFKLEQNSRFYLNLIAWKELKDIFSSTIKVIKTPTFPKLKSILGDFTFFENFKITDLGPFPLSFCYDGKIDIFGLSITHVDGLKKVDPTKVTNLKITDNPKLSLCNNRFICAYLALGKPSQFSKNAQAATSHQKLSARRSDQWPSIL